MCITRIVKPECEADFERALHEGGQRERALLGQMGVPLRLLVDERRELGSWRRLCIGELHMQTGWERLGSFSSVFLRCALGLSLLSAVADRFGWWGAFGQPH